MPSELHTATPWSPTANLENEKKRAGEDAANSRKEEIDNLDALMIEKTTSSNLASFPCQIRQASNHGYGSR